MAEWEAHTPEGDTIQARMMDVVRRYLGETVARAQGMERMMAQQGANRMYPRIEQWVRSRTDEDLKSELRKLQELLDKVIGEAPRKAGKSAGTAQGLKKSRPSRSPKNSKSPKTSKNRGASNGAKRTSGL